MKHLIILLYLNFFKILNDNLIFNWTTRETSEYIKTDAITKSILLIIQGLAIQNPQ